MSKDGPITDKIESTQESRDNIATPPSSAVDKGKTRQATSITLRLKPLKGKLRALLGYLSDRLFEDRCNCIICGREYAPIVPEGICQTCNEKLPRNDADYHCPICSRPVRDKGYYCENCKVSPRAFKSAYAPFLYEDSIKAALQRYKFHSCRYYAKYFAACLVKAPVIQKGDYDVICYVPSYGERFCFAGHLAQEVSRLTGKPLCHAVIKQKQTEAQHTLSGTKRLHNLEKCFAVPDKSMLKHKRVLLIDDIITTSATINEVSKTLLKSAQVLGVECVAVAIVK